MRILVCSHGSFDIIRSATGFERRTPGGAFATIAALALVAPEATILPVVGVGRDSADELREWCRQFPNVDTECFVDTNEPTHVVRYFEKESGTHVRCSSVIAAPIPFKSIKPKLQGVDAALVAMNSGEDIALETLDEIRMELQGKPIHLDVHSLVLGRDEGRGRPYRPLPTWRRWFFNCSTVQLNEVEAAAITPDHMVEEHFVKQALALGIAGLCITRDERGTTLYREEHKKTTVDEIRPAASGGTVSATIGCGDVFAGTFVARYVQTHDILASARAATLVSGWTASLASPEDIRERLKEHPLP